MVAESSFQKRLTRLEADLTVRWKSTLDPVRRLLLLRNHFFRLHEILNEAMADPSCPEIPASIEDPHLALAALPLRWLKFEPQSLLLALSDPDPLSCLEFTGRQEQAGAPGGSATVPAHLLQPGREWEALIYQLALHCGWKGSKVELVLQGPEKIQAWIRQASEFRDSGPVTLSLEKKSDGPHSWWAHQVEPAK